MKSDDSNLLGKHVFEAAGLGRAPFRFLGVYEKVGPIEISPGCFAGSPGQPMGCCDYCGQGIRYCCSIRDADGKVFTVGSDCVKRTGDANMVRAYKTSPFIRAANRAKTQARNEAVSDELSALLSEPMVRDALARIPSNLMRNPDGSYARFDVRCSVLASVERSLPWCGAAGRAKNLRYIHKALSPV